MNTWNKIPKTCTDAVSIKSSLTHTAWFVKRKAGVSQLFFFINLAINHRCVDGGVRRSQLRTLSEE